MWRFRRKDANDSYSNPASGRYGWAPLSLGAGLTGLQVALSASLASAVLIGALLKWRGHDLNQVLRGETAFASPGAGTVFVLLVFLSFLWGGYTAGRMAAGSGAKNGALVPVLALLALSIAAAVPLLLGEREVLRVPFGIGMLPLDGNFTPLGFAVVACVGISLVAGGIWGGILGARWHLRLNYELEPAYETSSVDSFSDLVGRTSRY